MAKFFSADLHVGETPARGNPSYYRPVSPDEYTAFFLKQCYQRIKPTDDLYLLGDLAITLEDLKFYNNLPECNLHIVCGNKEHKIPDFVNQAELKLPKFSSKVEIITDFGFVDIGKRTWRMAHRPSVLCGFATGMPSLCGHAHGFWRTRRLPDGSPIINVGLDAWNGSIVTEEYLELQYEGVMDGSFNKILDFPEAH